MREDECKIMYKEYQGWSFTCEGVRWMNALHALANSFSVLTKIILVNCVKVIKDWNCKIHYIIYKNY